MAFDQTVIRDLYAAVLAKAQTLGDFSSITGHEPKSAPISLPALAVWWGGIGPARGASGLNATAARCEFRARVYLNYLARPEDDIDPLLTYLAGQVIGAFSGGFTLGGEVMAVDLLGAYGPPLAASTGYIDHDSHQFRVAEITVPVVLDDVWTQAA